METQVTVKVLKQSDEKWLVKIKIMSIVKGVPAFLYKEYPGIRDHKKAWELVRYAIDLLSEQTEGES